MHAPFARRFLAPIGRGRPPSRALRRDGVVLTEAPQLIGLYGHSDVFPGDHIVFYYAQDWERQDMPAPNFEIAEQGFFETNNLPDETNLGMRRRIAEMFSGQPLQRGRLTWKAALFSSFLRDPDQSTKSAVRVPNRGYGTEDLHNRTDHRDIREVEVRLALT